MEQPAPTSAQRPRESSTGSFDNYSPAPTSAQRPLPPQLFSTLSDEPSPTSYSQPPPTSAQRPRAPDRASSSAPSLVAEPAPQPPPVILSPNLSSQPITIYTSEPSRPSSPFPLSWTDPLTRRHANESSQSGADFNGSISDNLHSESSLYTPREHTRTSRNYQTRSHPCAPSSVAESEYRSSFSIPTSILEATDNRNNGIAIQDQQKHVDGVLDISSVRWSTTKDQTAGSEDEDSTEDSAAEQDQHNAETEGEEHLNAYAEGLSPSEYKPTSSLDRSQSSDPEELIPTALLSDSTQSESEGSLTPDISTNHKTRRSER